MTIEQDRANFAANFNKRIAPISGHVNTPMPVYRTPNPQVAKQVLDKLTRINDYQHPKKKAAAEPKKKKAAKKKVTVGATKPLNSEDPKVKFDAIVAAMNGNSLTNKLTRVSKGAARGALDVISRPLYAVAEGGTRIGKGINEGQEAWTLGDDALSGLWGGISGKDKTGFGSVVEQFAKPESETEGTRTHSGQIAAAILGGGANLLRKTQEIENQTKNTDQEIPGLGGFNVWGKRGLGLAGELAADPLNWVGGEAVSVARGSAKVAAKEVVEEGVAKFAREAAEEAAKAGGHKLNAGSWMLAKGVEGPRIPGALENVDTVARKTVEDTVLGIQGGAHKNSLITGNRVFLPEVAAQTQETFKQSLLRPFENKFDRIMGIVDPATGTRVGGGGMTVAQMKRAAQSDPIFKRFYDELVNLSSGNILGAQDDIIEEAARIARAEVDDAVADYGVRFAEKAKGQFYNAPALRVGNKKLVFERVGRAYEDATRTLDRNLTKGFSYGAAFPGQTAVTNMGARALGTRLFEEAQKEVRTVANTLTRAERKEMTHLLQQNIVPSDPKMEAAFHFIKDQYEQVRRAEVGMGVRNDASAIADNYNYLWMRGNPEKIRKFKALRKEEVALNNHLNSGINEARAMGIRPEEDAFKNLQYRHAKAQRDMTRAYFVNDILDHYGFHSRRLTKAEAKARNLVEVKSGQAEDAFNIPISKTHQRAGGHAYKVKDAEKAWYLPSEMHSVLDSFHDMSSLGRKSDESARLLRVFDWLTNKFKYSVTVPYPGFHVRNMVGDVYMGFLDGVTLRDHKAIWKLAEERLPEAFGKTGQAAKFSKIRIAGREFSFDELWRLYQDNAAFGNYMSADLQEAIGSGGGNFIGKAASKANRGLREGAELREDMGRFVHFYSAFKQEFNGKNLDSALKASTWRVNKYKFDYGALMPFEKNVAKRVMPFYTYTRKAMPTLLESLFLSPKWLSRVNRVQQYSENSDAYNPLRIPEWAREVGYAKIGGSSENPLIMTGDVLPTGSLQMLNETTAQGLAQQMMGQVNPWFKPLPELATGHSTFNAAPIAQKPGNIPFTDTQIPKTADYLLNALIPPYRSASGTDAKLGDPGFSPTEFLMGDRMGLGLSVKKLTDKIQVSSMNSQFYKINKEAIGELTPKLDKFGFTPYLSNRKDGASFRVKDKGTDDIVFDGTLEDLLVWSQQLANGEIGRQP